MTSASGRAAIRTYHGTRDGAFGVTILDGRVEGLTRAVTRATAEETGELHARIMLLGE